MASDSSSPSTDTNALIPKFRFTNLLNQDQGGRRIVLQGTIDSLPALLLVERGAFDTNPTNLADLPAQFHRIQNLGANDIYHWYLASSGTHTTTTPPTPTPSDLKLNLIYPSTPKHTAKYAPQQPRFVIETPHIYRTHILPYMRQCRTEGRLNWVFNILSGAREQENVLYRSSLRDPTDDFLLLPDLNWDRTTRSSLHLLALVARRDLWSLRDLTKHHVPWLRHFRDTLAHTVEALYPGVEADMLKFYVHYQPTYYHFHVHVVHVDLDAGATQAVGKALGLDTVVSWLESMGGGEGAGMADVELAYTVGEKGELWERVWAPLKRGEVPVVGE